MQEHYNNYKKRILFIGIPDMAYICLNALRYANINIVGVMGPFKNHNMYYPFKNFVKSLHLNFIEYDDLKSPELLDIIKHLKIDLAVVCSYNNKIPMEFINSIKDGIVNLHPSLLPNYRGGNPYSWVIINGEKETGVTLHFMSENFDEGDIICQEKCLIEPYDTMGTIFDKTNKIGCKLLLETLIKYDKQGYLSSQKQPSGNFIKANNLKDHELYINYNKTAVEIERFVRSVNPYLNAITFFKGQYTKLFKVKAVDDIAPDDCKNGEIYKIIENDVYIKTSKGAIIPEIMQYCGSFTGDKSDFIKIAQPKIGDIFTNG